MNSKLTATEVVSFLKGRERPWFFQEAPPLLRGEFHFSNFMEGLNFLNKIGQISEDLWHHPEVKISFKKVIVELSTHDVGGISQLDLEFIKLADKDYERFKSSNF